MEGGTKWGRTFFLFFFLSCFFLSFFFLFFSFLSFFFFFFFFFFLLLTFQKPLEFVFSKTTKICFGSTKMEIFYREKNQEKWLCPLRKIFLLRSYWKILDIFALNSCNLVNIVLGKIYVIITLLMFIISIKTVFIPLFSLFSFPSLSLSPFLLSFPSLFPPFCSSFPSFSFLSSSGVARTCSGGRVAHPEGQNEDKN